MYNGGNKMESDISRKNKGVAYFLIFSITGIIVFFASFIPREDFTVTPLVYLIDWVKGTLGEGLYVITFILMMFLTLTSILSFFIKDNKFLNYFHGGDSKVARGLYILGGMFTITFFFKLGPNWWQDPDVGQSAWRICGSVLVTVGVAGGLVSLVTEFGLLEFIGTLMEPFMRPLYNLPGTAAVDAVTSFVSSSSVAVYITNKLYLDKHYTKREASNISVNFSVASLGLFVVLVQMANEQHLYTKLVVSSFIITFIMAAIVGRIPPISKIPDEFIDGTKRKDSGAEKVKSKGTFKRAWKAGVEKADGSHINLIWKEGIRSIAFSVKIVAYVAAIAPIAMALSKYTPIFQWLGILFTPYLKLVAIYDAAKIAPSIVVEITQIVLPLLIVLDKNVALSSISFVMLVSTVQIIFFNESANAIIESEIPLGFWNLVLLFF